MKPRTFFGSAFALLIGATLVVSCGQPTPADTPTEETPSTQTTDSTSKEIVTAAMLSSFASLPNKVSSSDYQLTDEIITLGRMLYYEPRISVNQQVSCNSCHALDQYGVDGLPTSVGHDGQSGSRNAPTVYNAALHIAQFWDGRSPDVEDQAKGPIVNPIEMGMPSGDDVTAALRAISGYDPLFAAAFPNDPDPITYENAATAIGAFERRLLTPSRFDQFLEGDTSQLSEQEQRGLTTFVTVGCATCHNNAAVGGMMYQKLGIVQAYITDDLGRFDITGQENDRYVFKVPSLRNIAETTPYLHDGSITTLDEMVRMMGRHQLGRELTDTQVNDIIAFLESLTGEIPYDYIAPPQLPDTEPTSSDSSG
ncbi:MAG: cytochrome-c peroxidase [Chloroflexales bacterium]|nr:cytochrome-c peroxidase [Chloroflexales bacterium]